MIIFDTSEGFSSRQLAAKLVYNDLLDSNKRLGLHDAIIHTIDESGINGNSLVETLQNLFEGLEREGIGRGVISETWWNSKA